MIKIGTMMVYDTIQTQAAFWFNVFFKYAKVVAGCELAYGYLCWLAQFQSFFIY